MTRRAFYIPGKAVLPEAAAGLIRARTKNGRKVPCAATGRPSTARRRTAARTCERSPFCRPDGIRVSVASRRPVAVPAAPFGLRVEHHLVDRAPGRFLSVRKPTWPRCDISSTTWPQSTIDELADGSTSFPTGLSRRLRPLFCNLLFRSACLLSPCNYVSGI